MVKRKDLVDVGDKNYQERQGEFMLCRNCGNEMGGMRGDFWQLDQEYVFKCPECKSKRVELVVAQRKYIKVK